MAAEDGGERRTLAAGSADPSGPAPYDSHDVAAIQALATGTADAGQQARALRWIVEVAAEVGGQSWRYRDPDGTSFAEGRRYVGRQIQKLLLIKIGLLREAEERRRAATTKEK